MPLGGGAPLVDTTIYGWQGNQQAPAGGISPAYSWFANQEIPELAIDNTLLKDFDTLALSPANPTPLGVGTVQTFTLSASLFGVPDPLTPGLTPANVAFTQGGTGSVTVVPSGTQPNNGTFSFNATGGTVGTVNLTANIDIFPSNTASFNVIQPALYSPVNGSTLPGSSVTFYWTEYPGATAYWLDVGSAEGGNNYAQSGSLSSSTLSYTVNNLPTNGSTVWGALVLLRQRLMAVQRLQLHGKWGRGVQGSDYLTRSGLVPDEHQRDLHLDGRQRSNRLLAGYRQQSGRQQLCPVRQP